jgi:hypothetical protein
LDRNVDFGGFGCAEKMDLAFADFNRITHNADHRLRRQRWKFSCGLKWQWYIESCSNTNPGRLANTDADNTGEHGDR